MSASAPVKRAFFPTVRKNNLIVIGVELALLVGLAVLVILGHPEMGAINTALGHLTPGVIVALITVMGVMGVPTITGVFTLATSKKNAAKLDEIHVLVNSRLSIAVKVAADSLSETARLWEFLVLKEPANTMFVEAAKDARTRAKAAMSDMGDVAATES